MASIVTTARSGTAALTRSAAVNAIGRPSPPLSPRARLLIGCCAVFGAALLALFGLREFAFTDYEGEALPAVQRLLDGDVQGFLTALPLYAGAVVLNAPFALLGAQVGGDADLWAWRAQALPGLALFAVLGSVLGRALAGRIGGRIGVAWGAATALLLGGAPLALLALETGHPEELLVSGMVLAAVLLAVGGRLTVAAIVVGLAAVAKPWALVAIPVVLLAAHDRRTLVRMALTCAAAGALLAAPVLLAGGTDRVQTQTTASASTSGIFKPDNVFWFAGRTNPAWNGSATTSVEELFQTDATKARWAQRLEPTWAARVSRPAILLFAIVLALAFRRCRGTVFARDDLLLVLAGVCWWRCMLDTWNVHYYALAALLALTAWEARRGRPPVASIVATALAWLSFQTFTTEDMTPDVHTALYLTWALPLGLGIVWRALAPTTFRRTSAALLRPLSRHLPTLTRALAARS